VIIAVDGPAASGKSTVARALARRLGAGYLDTGAMYRAVAAEALRIGVPTDDPEALAALAAAVCIAFEREAGSPIPTRVLIDGRDVTTEIRTPAVDTAVSPVSAVAASGGDWVVEGRDIGTVVFPETPVKVFLTASAEERARRREGDMHRIGVDTDAAEVQRRLEARDTYDSTREASPLTPAVDAVRIDTTGMTVDEVVELIAGLAGREG
jgi:cytidylate kinase